MFEISEPSTVLQESCGGFSSGDVGLGFAMGVRCMCIDEIVV